MDIPLEEQTRSRKNWRRKDMMPKLERDSQDPIHQEKAKADVQLQDINW